VHLSPLSCPFQIIILHTNMVMSSG
jgi:hypothetical protein